MITIKIDGLRVLEDFNGFRRGYMGHAREEVLRPIGLEAAKRFRKYPPPLQYRRTYTFQKRWRVTRENQYTIGIFNWASYPGNPAYASKVVGDEHGRGQASVHFGRWPVGFSSGLDLVEKTAEQFTRRADAVFTTYIRSWRLN